MGDNLHAWGVLRKLSWQDVLLVLAVVLLARLLVLFVRWRSAGRPKRRRRDCG